MPKKPSRGFVTFVPLALLMVIAGVWRYLAGDIKASNTFMYLAVYSASIAIAFEMLSLHTYEVKRRLPRILG